MGKNKNHLLVVAALTGLTLFHFCASAASIQATEIGHQIFIDPQFSVDHATSCSTCHLPERAFSSPEPVAVGHDHLHGTRNAPSLLNAVHYRMFFWDGRAPSLEDQVLRPFVNEREFGMHSHSEVLEKLRMNQRYASEFREVFGAGGKSIQIGQVASVLAAYVRSLGGQLNRLDCFLEGNHPEALTPVERDGLEVFRGVGGCDACHTVEGRPASFTDNKFHISGIGFEKFSPTLSDLSRKLAGLDSVSRENLIFRDPTVAAAGRFVVTLDPKDIGAFRTPSLRNVALTAPYMHDGSLKTLEEAVDYELYYTGSLRGTPIIVTPAQKASLLAFLESLNDMPANEQACKSATKVGLLPTSGSQ